MTFIAILLLSFLIIGVAIAAMSIGVMSGRSPIKGSCGGLNAGGCELCRGDREDAARSGKRAEVRTAEEPLCRQ